MSLYTASLSQAWFQSHLCPRVTLGEPLPSGGLGSLPTHPPSGGSWTRAPCWHVSLAP